MDAVNAFLEAAVVGPEGHKSGDLFEANALLETYPEVARSNIYTAAVLGDDAAVRNFVERDPAIAVAKGGHRGWDPLTHLCFSRYLRLDRDRSEAFVGTARALLERGAPANTGWIEMIDHPNERPILESAIYGAAGVAHHAGLTRLLLEYGADPNDEETPYHVVESDDNTVLRALLVSGKLNEKSLNTILLRKCDWHDPEGVQMALEHGANPNAMTVWGVNALHQAVRRDNALKTMELLMDHGADPTVRDDRGLSAIAIAARRGRAGALDLFEKRGVKMDLAGVDALIAACARDRMDDLFALAGPWRAMMIEHGGTLLAQFAGVGNLAGVRNLLDLGVPVDALYREGDGYFGIALSSTALHVAAWRAWPEVVKELIARGAPIEVKDRRGQTPLQLAVKACIDSHWTDRRSPHSVRALLEAGASKDGIAIPTGYDEIDRLLVS
jgi:ankyrin repeat protein